MISSSADEPGSEDKEKGGVRGEGGDEEGPGR